MICAADFETTTDPLDCRVWAWGFTDIYDPDLFKYGNDIDSFMSVCASWKDNITMYFHNLKFDGEFIIYWLFKNGYKHVKDKKELTDKTFTTLISDRGVFYSIKICFLDKGKSKKLLTLYDSLKLLPFSVDEVAKAFNLEISKLKIDYDKYRPVGHILDNDEIAYLHNDIYIMAQALKILFSQGLDKMTIGANALKEYKNIIGDKKFKKLFPKTLYDHDIRQSYKGGYSFVNPIFKEKDIGEGIVLDVNSLYPSVMYYSPLPYGEGIFFEGKYKEDKYYNLYIQMFRCYFKLKPNKLPTIQLKNDLSFVPTEYLTSSGDEYVTLCLTSVDLELFFEHYEVYDIDYISGWKFKSAVGLFKEYIDKWNAVKVQATIDKNGSMRTIAKLMLNNLYGKFATNPNVQSKIPYLGDDDIIHYSLGEKETREAVYIPVGTFITAWARYKTITSAQKCYSRFIYADTDSLHLVGTHLPEELEISDTKLGAWKIEEQFIRGRYLQQKTYIEEIITSEKDIDKFIEKNPDLINLVNRAKGTILKVTCAGMPKGCYPYVTWDNFHVGSEYPGKLKATHTAGGIVLKESPHKLRGKKA